MDGVYSTYNYSTKYYIHMYVAIIYHIKTCATAPRSYPSHDSANILLVRSANYRKHVESVREWYSGQHHNWTQVDGERSQWWVWEEAREEALTSARHIQHYLARITSGPCVHARVAYIDTYRSGSHLVRVFMHVLPTLIRIGQDHIWSVWSCMCCLH